MQAAAHNITIDQVETIGATYFNDAKAFIAALNAVMGILSQLGRPGVGGLPRS